MSNPEPQAELVLQMPGDIQVSLPKPIRNLSTFVLKEQGDWFEYEIKFLRKLIKPGMNVIDIGANYGLYSLTMARAVTDSGHVWAFEPASSTIGYLQQSIRLNQFANITLIEQGLSDKQGEANFYLAANSELNSLNPKQQTGPVEVVKLTTLDQCLADYDWPQIDFIKLDAEGEEGRILESSGKLLRQMSPLVMFELKHAKQVNLPLINAFLEYGYQTYRLLPGPEILVPFDHTRRFDSYQLNLFCCKPEKARQLADQGVLVESLEAVSANVGGTTRTFYEASPFSERIAQGNGLNDDRQPSDMENMLDFYLTAQDQSVSPGQRVACLDRALRISAGLTRKKTLPIEQAATHARIASDAGERQHAVQMLLATINANNSISSLELKAPFLPAVPRYDAIDPGERLNPWLVSSVLEKWVIEHAYSSYFTAQKALPALQRLTTLGFIDPSISRRYDLVSKLKFN